MSTAFRFPLAATVVALCVALASPARADENMLRGPHPFLKSNELSAHILLAGGGGSTPGGTKLAVDYGYKLAPPLWFDVALNYQHSTCHEQSGATTCSQATGDVWETLAGVKLKFATAIPVVPFVKAMAGFAFEFPDGRYNGGGIAGRVGGGANYFFYDWLGLGVELGVSFGYLSTNPTGYSVIDFGGGLEFQF
ncbi:MAG TPA: hypothetical protein VHJ20_01225 [Polyangia bacterium]|nr:hypothetical protein [Polyangia bacterium]